MFFCYFRDTPSAKHNERKHAQQKTNLAGGPLSDQHENKMGTAQEKGNSYFNQVRLRGSHKSGKGRHEKPNRDRSQKPLGLKRGVFGMGLPRLHAETELKFSQWVEEIKFKGDLRLRQENFDKSPKADGTLQADRQRQRFRLRLAVDAKLPHNLEIKTRFASGSSNPRSTDQTLEDNKSLTRGARDF